MTYTALATLKICGDTPGKDSPFSRVDKRAIVDSIRQLQGGAASQRLASPRGLTDGADRSLRKLLSNRRRERRRHAVRRRPGDRQ